MEDDAPSNTDITGAEDETLENDLIDHDYLNTAWELNKYHNMILCLYYKHLRIYWRVYSKKVKPTYVLLNLLF